MKRIQKQTNPQSSKEISARSAKQLGEALYRHRTLKGMSQADLAKEAGVRQATISKAESGAEVKLGTLIALSAALGLELVLRGRPTDSEFRPEEFFK
jgi:transcriptional regulator with XRE-family HTH domain